MRELADLKIRCTANGTTHQDTNIPDIATKLTRAKLESLVEDLVSRTIEPQSAVGG